MMLTAPIWRIKERQVAPAHLQAIDLTKLQPLLCEGFLHRLRCKPARTAILGAAMPNHLAMRSA
ncbi:hypothetical protein C7W88_21560 (plasmid) [Novosphingobium sp. THN1]|jgi:hypothetical protein|nr:hypothetical protein C7W88_21560 [Novosphingobium sp. THN1]